MIWLAAAICLPSVGVPVLMMLTAVPDISGLSPKTSFNSDGYVLLDWNGLERGDRALRADGLATGSRVRALGYMMDADQPVLGRNRKPPYWYGQLVTQFLLLPDAGNAFQAAHRFGDQMISVQIESGNTVRFTARKLVWVWGVLRALPGNPAGLEPLYRIEDARTGPAERADILRYFQ